MGRDGSISKILGFRQEEAHRSQGGQSNSLCLLLESGLNEAFEYWKHYLERNMFMLWDYFILFFYTVTFEIIWVYVIPAHIQKHWQRQSVPQWAQTGDLSIILKTRKSFEKIGTSLHSKAASFKAVVRFQSLLLNCRYSVVQDSVFLISSTVM